MDEPDSSPIKKMPPGSSTQPRARTPINASSLVSLAGEANLLDLKMVARGTQPTAFANHLVVRRKLSNPFENRYDTVLRSNQGKTILFCHDKRP